MSRNSEIEVWTDGDCALCQRSRRWVERRDERGVILIRDFRSASDAQLPVPRSRVEAELVAHSSDGRIYCGFGAWRRIIAKVPRWRWLAPVLGIPPLSWLGTMVYRLVARYRHRLG
jgi:predicted DCC family thiol-disulfide oxidoreductase YuxK